MQPAARPRPPLRVLMVSDVYFPRINGVSTSIETFRADLADQGVAVQLVAPAYPEAVAAPDTWRVPSRRLPFDPEDRLMHWGELVRTIDRLPPMDLVHIQTPFVAHYAGRRLARRLKVPVVSTYHTHFEEYIHHYLPLLPRRLLRNLARGIARHQCDSLAGVIVPSPAMAATLRGYGVGVPLHVLPTGIPVARFAGGDGRRFRRRHGLPPERPLALYVGRVAHEKNIGFLLQALERARLTCPELLLVVAGEGPALPALRQEAEQRQLGAQVRFVGYLDRESELPDCYAAADVFVFASRTETQGLVLLEAMAAGLPVYALACLGTRSIIEPGLGAIAAPDDVQAFGDGMAALIGDPARRAALAEAGRAFAQQWSAPERARQLAALYHRLVV